MEKNLTLTQLIDKVGEENIFGTDIVDSATQQELVDYFYYRYICDNEKFIHFFKRNMRQYNKQYVNMLRIENTQFDPMTTRYLERQVLNKVSNSGSQNIQDTINESINGVKGGNSRRKIDTVGTTNGSASTNESNSYNNTTNGSHNDSSSDGRNSTDRQRDILSVFPQANVGSNTSGSLDDAISYRYATQMNDKQNKHSENGNTNSSGSNSSRENGTGTSNGSSQSNSRSVVDGTELTTNDLTEQATKEGSNNKAINTRGTEEGDLRERLTGRENYDAGTLLEHARDYIRNTNAFMWYVSKLEKCFIGNLRYGED